MAHLTKGCTCPPVKDLVGIALTGTEPPACPTHRPEPASPPLALNNDTALAGKLLGTLNGLEAN